MRWLAGEFATIAVSGLSCGTRYLLNLSVDLQQNIPV